MRPLINLFRARIQYNMNLYRTAALVTAFSAAEHCLGFLYRILLSRTLGPEGLGVYQVALTVFAVFLTISSSGLPVTLSRTISKHRADGARPREHAATSAAVLLALAVSVPATILLFLLRTPFSRVFSDPRCADLFYIVLPGLAFTSVYSVVRGSFWGNRRFLAYSLVELCEEMIRICAGVILLVFLQTSLAGVNRAAFAVLLSYLCSFALALGYYFFRGGKFRSPKGELRPLLASSLPVTAMRTSSSLMSSLISVIFPLRMQAAGFSSSAAMSEYGVVYGMVSPVMAIPCAFIGSIALVLVPELSENFYKGRTREVGALTERAICTTLLIAGLLLPFYIVCGEDVGVFLYSNARSGAMIAACAFVLVPMSLTLISTSMLNSMGCEKHTLGIFLAGSGAMLLCTVLLPRYLGGGALLAGMACDSCITALLSLLLLRKKTGRLRIGKYCLRLLAAVLLCVALGLPAHAFCARYLSYFPAFAVTMLLLAAAEVLLFSLMRLIDVRTLLCRFFAKKSKKISVRS